MQSGTAITFWPPAEGSRALRFAWWNKMTLDAICDRGPVNLLVFHWQHFLLAFSARNKTSPGGWCETSSGYLARSIFEAWIRSNFWLDSVFIRAPPLFTFRLFFDVSIIFLSSTFRGARTQVLFDFCRGRRLNFSYPFCSIFIIYALREVEGGGRIEFWRISRGSRAGSMFRRDNGRCEQEMNFQHLGGRPECDEGPRQFLPVVRRALEGPVSLSVSNRMKRRVCVCVK